MRPKKPPWQLGWRWVYYRPGGGKDGPGGVREPRRPRPHGGSGGVSLKPLRS
jgi:hypothetical protein